jgi:phosphate transport system substrate-binding protein
MRKTSLLGALALAGTITAGIPAAAQAVAIDNGIQPYKKASGVSGNLNSIGSDTLNNVMTLWAESFQKQYPNVKIQIEGKGSGTAPPALIAGTSQLGPMSRLMKPEELDSFEKQYGYKPTPIRVAVDGIGVFVNKDNPIDKLTMAQVDAIFSKTRKGGAPEDITTWGQLGLSGEWGSKPISLFGRNSSSGTYGYFKEHALAKGDYKDTVKETPGSAAVVQGITADKFAIGYSGVGYRTSDVKTVKLAAKDGGDYVADDAANVYSGKYPLARFLYVYVNRAPGKPLDPLVREFLKFVLSRDGQEIVVKDGFLPLLGQHVAEEAKNVQ